MTNRPTFDELLDDWMETGPSDAPQPLLGAIVGAVPAVPQRRPGRLSWLRAPIAGLALAAAAMVVVVGAAAVLVAFRPAGLGAGATGSPSPTGPGASSAIVVTSPSPEPAVLPTATPTAVPESSPTENPGAGVASCKPGNLSAQVTAWEGAAGSRIADVVLTNTGAVACSTRSLDRPQLIDANGTLLISGAAPIGSAELTIPAGGSASTLVRSANYCGPDPALPVTVGFIVPGGARVVATPFAGSDVPPCNGPTLPGDVEMQPWSR